MIIAASYVIVASFVTAKCQAKDKDDGRLKSSHSTMSWRRSEKGVDSKRSYMAKVTSYLFFNSD